MCRSMKVGAKERNERMLFTQGVAVLCKQQRWSKDGGEEQEEKEIAGSAHHRRLE